jgi:hypothetical protein
MDLIFSSEVLTVGADVGLRLTPGEPARAAITDTAWGALPVEETPVARDKRPRDLRAAQIDGGTGVGTVKSVLGFRQFHLRGLDGATGEWMLLSVASRAPCSLKRQRL